MTAREFFGAVGLLVAFGVAVVNGGCASKQEPAPCDALTLATMTATCAARVRACDPEPAPCPAQDECFAQLDARQAECLGRLGLSGAPAAGAGGRAP